MRARFDNFGEIEIDGKQYRHDVLIQGGVVRKRKKTASKAYRDDYGHTPLSSEEPIPWGGRSLYIGTGMYGALPVMPAVYKEAEQRGVELVVDRTGNICRLLQERRSEDINAILHVTC
ncbi:MAG: hypothetical protein KDI74_03955 [Gammaproteobacteria bacterium]|nr:hypothetical protein [Gammaproteobacteria bacterium]